MKPAQGYGACLRVTIGLRWGPSGARFLMSEVPLKDGVGATWCGGRAAQSLMRMRTHPGSPAVWEEVKEYQNYVNAFIKLKKMTIIDEMSIEQLIMGSWGVGVGV